MGNVSFGELAYWLITLRRPTPQQSRLFEAVLLGLADHGFTPTAIAARLTYLSAPDAIQGALAAGILGGGSRFLGVTEDTGRFLADVLQAAWPAARGREGLGRPGGAGGRRPRRRAGRFVPGLGHPVHKEGDPRTPLIIGIAREEGLYGPHLALFEAIGRVHPQVLGKRLPLNGAGVSGAALADLGPAAGTAPRRGAAGPLRRTARPHRRGNPAAHRQLDLPDRRPQRRVHSTRHLTDLMRREPRCGAAAPGLMGFALIAALAWLNLRKVSSCEQPSCAGIAVPRR